MMTKAMIAVTALIYIPVLVACGGADEDQEKPGKKSSDLARGVERMQMPESTPISSQGPTEVAVELALEESTVEIDRILQCIGMPGAGLGFAASTDDYVGDGSAGVRVGGGFEHDSGKVMINTRNKQWVTEAEGATLKFERTDTRTGDGYSFVTIVATGTALSDAGELPFNLTVTCAPAGQRSRQGTE